MYCCGQPTVAGFKGALEKVCGTVYPKTGKILWVNMRQEPNIYVNGEPYCARPPNKIGEYAELGNVTAEQLERDEEEFLEVVRGRAEAAGGKVQYLDVHKAELEVECKELVSLGAVVKQLQKTYPGLRHIRVPVCNSASPLERDYDTITSALVGTGVSSPVIVNCQVSEGF